MSVLINFGSARLRLLSDKAIWWPNTRSLLLSDIHLGKDQVFRHHGLALPQGVLARDLDRLDCLIEKWKPEHLLILGDLVHAPPRSTDRWPDEVSTWRRRNQQLAMTVVLGNHDRSMSTVLADWKMNSCSTTQLENIALMHEFDSAHPRYAIAGHIHPVIRLADGKIRTRVPIFWQSGRSLTLPSFGTFTGGHAIDHSPGDRIWAVAGEMVMPVMV